MKQFLHLRITKRLTLCLLVAQCTIAFGQSQNYSASLADSSTKSQVPAPAALRPELIVQVGHSAFVDDAAFSPDGRFVATCSKDATARLWDATTGLEIRRFPHENLISAVAFSPDGKRILTATSSLLKGEGESAYLWDIATGKILQQFSAHSSIRSIAFSPDGLAVLLGGADLQLFDLASAKLIRKFAGPTDWVTDLEFSRSGGFVLAASEDKTARIWETASAKQLAAFEHPQKVKACAFSPDEQFIITGSEDKLARIWNVNTKTIAQEFALDTDYINSVACSPDGRYIATASAKVQLWDRQTSKPVWQSAESFVPRHIAFSPQGNFIVTADGYDKTATLWETGSGKIVHRFEGKVSAVHSVAFSPDGRFIATGNEGNAARLWETFPGGESKLLGENISINAVAFSHNSRLVAIGGWGDAVLIFDTATGQQAQRFDYKTAISSLAFTADDRSLVTGSLLDKSVRKWDLATGKEVFRIDTGDSVNAVACSSNGKYILTGIGSSSTQNYYVFSVIDPKEQEKNSKAILWDAYTGARVRGYGGGWMVDSVAFSPDDKVILLGGSSASSLYDLTSGSPIGLSEGLTFNGLPAVFSPNGRSILTGSGSFWQRLVTVDFNARLYSRSGEKLQRFIGHSFSVNAVTFSPDGRFVLTGSADGTSRLWKAETGAEICRLVSFKDGNWVVVTPDGRFDTNDLQAIRGLHWLMPDDPLNALPLEIFMRDYYEPQLLQRYLAGERFGEIKNLSQLNRAQPKVEITKIVQQGDAPDTVAVTVAVAKGTGRFRIGGKELELQTGVYDLRLFRDAQLVAYAPKPAEEISLSTGLLESVEQPQNWRTRTAVKLDANGQATHTFTVKLPRTKDLSKVEFSAYAFNEDRIKSATSRFEHSLENPLPPIKGRAYVLTIGVRASESPVKRLTYAAKDAKRIGEVLSASLASSQDYEKPTLIRLISDYRPMDGKLTENNATKAKIREVLRKLSGKPVDEDLLKGIENADQITQLRPEDLLVMAISSHGVMDGNGNFYFLPYDVGAQAGNATTDDLLKRSISSFELSEWLKELDAAEMVIIVDACHSEAAVRTEGFKPGPMGSRGLGQLAFDKRIKILAASQKEEKALEKMELKLSLLTYTLIEEGLLARQADRSPQDGKITVKEWLRYAVERVPTLAKKLSQANEQPAWQGKPTKSGREAKRESAPAKISDLQKPVLFDFSKRKRELVLVANP